MKTKGYKKRKKTIKTIIWAFSLAWKFDKVMLIGCFFLVSVVSMLPAVALSYNQAIIAALDRYVQFGEGFFGEIVSQILVFGLLTALAGFSNRLNEEFIYSIMFDSYYFGMEEMLMDSVQTFTMQELLVKEINDDFNSCVKREGSLTDFISGSCTLAGKLVGFGSLLFVAFFRSRMVFLISMMYLVLIILVNFRFMDKLRAGWNRVKQKERLSEYYEKMVETRECAKEIRLFRSKDYLISRWKETYQAVFDYENENNLAVEIRTLVSGLGFYFFLTVMIIYSLFLTAQGRMSPDVLLVLYTLGMNFYTGVSSIAGTLLFTSYGLYALEQQYRFFGRKYVKTAEEAKGEYGKVSTEEDTVFEARNVSFSYQKGKKAIDNLSFRIRKGETVALVGLNGSGKSTLVKLLLKLYEPDEGEFSFFGIPYRQIDEGKLQNNIGIFFQDFYLFHVPIGENIGFGDVEHIMDASRIEKAIEKGYARRIVEKAPYGLNTYIHRDVEKEGMEFSGGESQKLAMGRTYMSDKNVLIFDEPASMLDPISELEQFMQIQSMAEEKTAILISHRIGFARLADRVILMDQGRIAEMGTHQELMDKNGLYAKFFYEQARWYQEKINA